MMEWNSRASAWAVSALSLLPLSAFAANLLGDPGFEQVGAEDYFSRGVDGPTPVTLDGWTFLNSSGVTTWDPAHAGRASAYVNGVNGTTYSGSVSRTVGTQPGHVYLVSFWLSSNCCASGNLAVSFAGSQMTWTNLPANTPFTQYLFTATANDVNSVFQFSGSNLGGTYFLDDVAVTDTAEGLELSGFSGNSKSTTVTCTNMTTQQAVTQSFKASQDWDCRALGLTTKSKDRFRVTVTGTAR